MEGIETWIIALGFIGSPIYFLYLWQNHGPPRGGQWMSRMEVTKMRRVMAFVFGIFSLLGGILSLPGILAIVGIVIAAVLFAYTIGGKRTLKMIPGWRKYYDDSGE